METEETKSPLPSGKEPWLAVNLSRFFPGIGQFYAGQRMRGGLLACGYLTLLGFSAVLLGIPTAEPAIAIGLLVGSGLLWLVNIADAYYCTKKANTLEFEQLRKQTKDPWLAVFLSFLLLGLGHFYIGSLAIGFLLLAFVVAAIFIPLLSLLYVAIAPFAIYHAYHATPTQQI